MANSASQSSASVRPTRRSVLASGLSLLAVSATGLTTSRAVAQTGKPTLAKPVSQRSSNRLLARPKNLDMLPTRAKIVLELKGELQIEQVAKDAKSKVKDVEVQAKSTLDYFEKSAFEDSVLVSAAREYNLATAENWVAGNSTKFELRPDCKQTRLLPHDGSWQQFCESEMLDVREVQLLHSPVNTAALELLLPTEPAKSDSTWKLSSQDAKTLFNLEAAHACSVEAKISKIESGTATIEIKGAIEGTASSVPTKLEVVGNFRAKFTGRCVMVTWLGLVIKEKREISLSEPGFSITARVRLIRAAAEDNFGPNTTELRKLADSEDLGRWLVRVQSQPGRFSMLADRRWKTYLDTGEETILKMVENNTMIAQCNVTRLAKLDQGTQLTLEALQSEIKDSLGDQFNEFVQANEQLTSGKLRLMRCVVSGTAEDVPIQWVYNHLSDDTGRRLAMIFTMGGNVTDKFAAADEQMTSSLELLPELPAATPAPATGQETRSANNRTSTTK